MSLRQQPPFRADHVGSLLRLPELTAAKRSHAEGAISAAQLREVEDAAVAAAVAMQQEIGLQAVTDGELRRDSWHMDFIYQLGGISKADEKMKVRFQNADGAIEFTPAASRVDGRVHLAHTIFAEDFAFLQNQAASATAKLTIPSPSMVHYRGGQASIDDQVYPDVEEFWSDLSAAYAEQIRRLGALGCRYLQLDDTSLAYLNDPRQREQITARGEDGEHIHLRYIHQINSALAGRPAEMAITTHMCRGNFRSSWVAEGGYDFIAEALFNELAVDGFFMEWDDQRSGGFEPLRFVPPGKLVVLGLITTKRGELEQKSEIMRRIEEASRFIDIDQLCLSPQCGFSSTAEGNAVTAEQQRAKLQLVVEVAAEVWG